MKKLIALGFLSMLTASQAQASFMNTITGADMAGIQVTANFEDGSSETLLWDVINAGNGLTDTANLETQVGGVNGRMFSLTQQGATQGNTYDNGTEFDFTDDTYYGLWTLTNLSKSLLSSIIIDVLNTNVVFDSVFDDNGNGTDRGRAFTAMTAGTTYNYSDNIQDELFGKLTAFVDLDIQGELKFMADTDLRKVSAPAALSLMLLGLGGLVAVRRKKA